MNYKQCILAGDGDTRYTCWLPVKFAKVGKRVRLDSFGDMVWEVKSASKYTADEKVIGLMRDVHRYQRGTTDV